MPTLITQKNWKVLSPCSETQKLLSDGLGIHPVAAQLLINRGIKEIPEAKDFLRGGVDQLHDPFLFQDMQKAVDRVQQAQRNGETVLVFGDYDADGITASVVLRYVLKRIGIKVENHIPDRMNDGYGLNDQVVEVAQKFGATLVMSVDCGITAVKQALLLKKNNIDLIVIDHHEPSEDGIPDAVAVIDPKRSDCQYPFKHLAAVGLTAKFAQAMFGEIPNDILGLTALGTITDVVPLRGENRFFVKQGLPHIETTKNKGLQALLEVARIKGKKIKPYHAGFIIGPRINAAGRMDSARHALDLLLSDDDIEALELANNLNDINAKRQQLQRKIIQEALEMVEQDIDLKDQRVIVLAKEGWHIGILGIVASRVAETYYRPTIVASLNEGLGIASARSIEGFHLHDALTHCSDILEEFGGHKMAAGLKVTEKNLEEFRNRINDYALDNSDLINLTPTLLIDCEVPFPSLNIELIDMIDLLEPYGEGNRPPIFCTTDLVIKSRPVVLAKETLKFSVSDGNITVSVVGFGMGKYAKHLAMGQKIDLAYELLIDDWNKAPTVQLKLKDIRING